jgi:hypothetical protein
MDVELCTILSYTMYVHNKKYPGNSEGCQTGEDLTRSNKTSPCRNLTLSNAEGTRRAERLHLRRLDSAEKDIRIFAVRCWKTEPWAGPDGADQGPRRVVAPVKKKKKILGSLTQFLFESDKSDGQSIGRPAHTSLLSFRFVNWQIQ